jgi:NDP-sugar pyrophosphorylase family protein
MIEVRDVPIVEWQIRWLKSFGIAEFIVCVGYMKERIIDYLGSGSRLGAKIGYAVEEDPLGTGGALKNAQSLLSGQRGFFLLNGDILTSLDPNRLNNERMQAIALVQLRSPFGVVEVDSDSRVLGFVEKPQIPDRWINAGLYYFTQEIFEYLPENGNIEVTALPALAKEGKLMGVKYSDVPWRSIDSHKDIEEASKEMRALKI